MPEIAEAYTIASQLRGLFYPNSSVEDHVSKFELLNFRLSNRALRCVHPLVHNLDYLQVPCKVYGVTSHGKRPIIKVDGGILIFKLGMTGRIFWESVDVQEESILPYLRPDVDVRKCDPVSNNAFSMDGLVIEKHVNIGLVIGTTTELGPDMKSIHPQHYVWFSDQRYMGDLTYLPYGSIQDTYFSSIGPDLIHNPPEYHDFLQRMRSISQRKKIAELLMDQSVYAGIGNYLRSEILYYARISPYRTLKDIPDHELDILRQSILKIVDIARRHGGLTIKTYWAPNGKHGTYPRMVYQTNNGKDPYGNEVKRDTINKRSVFWVPTVQL